MLKNVKYFLNNKLKHSKTTQSIHSAFEYVLPPEQQLLLTAENRGRCLEELQKIHSLNRQVKENQNDAYASVLISLCIERNSKELSLLYTRRAATMSRHRSQISFPGGIYEHSDGNMINCALRETEEEIGLSRKRVDIWGHGGFLQLSNTPFIMPIIGFIPNLAMKELQINEHEVSEAFLLPLAKLNSNQCARHTQFKSGYSGPVFVIPPYRVWGITGYLTYIFLRCLLPPPMLCDTLKGNIRYIRPYRPNKFTTTTATNIH